MLRECRKPGIEESRQKFFFMKQILFLSLAILICSLLKAQVIYSDRYITVTKVNDPALSNSLMQIFNNLQANPTDVVKVSGIPSFNVNDFDFSNISKTEMNGKDGSEYSISCKKDTQFIFAVSYNRGKYFFPKISTSKIDKSGGAVTFLDQSLQTKMVYDGTTLSTVTYGVSLGIIQPMKFGKCVNECLVDIYSNHGLISAWATVQSAFIKQTVAAFAIVCGFHCLIESIF
jgi:hypothetical protein